MDLLMKSIVIGLLSACFILSTFNIIGVDGGRRLSDDEDIELEKHLKLLNKPSIKTIQMRPSSKPQELFQADKDGQEVKLIGVDCPIGTVPIRRVTKENLIRFNSNYNEITLNKGTHYSVVQTTFDSARNYTGGSAVISIYAPALLNSEQVSSARVKIKNGDNHIEFGWTVNPKLYGDSNPHLYTLFKAGDTKCFNLQCPGFVQIDNTYPVDLLLGKVSVSGGTIFDIRTIIYKDSGKWWLKYGNDRVKIGYWPENIFTSLKDSATEVEWGGEVSGPLDVPSPPMGSGRVPAAGPQYDAFCGDLKVEANGEFYDTNYIELFSDAKPAYGVSYTQAFNRYLQNVMFFGGPGGATGR